MNVLIMFFSKGFTNHIFYFIEAFLEHDVIITTEKKLDDHYDVVEELGK